MYCNDSALGAIKHVLAGRMCDDVFLRKADTVCVGSVADQNALVSKQVEDSDMALPTIASTNE